MLMLLPNCHTHVDIMSITEEVVVTVKHLLVDNYIQYSSAGTVRIGLRRKLDANKRFEESTVRLHTGHTRYRAVRDSKLKIMLYPSFEVVSAPKLDIVRACSS